MPGTLLTSARQDAKKFVKEGGFEESILLKTPSNTNELELNGLHSEHHLRFDTDGTPVNAQNAHITIDLQELVNANYPYLKNGKINLLDHKVTVKNSLGVDNYFTIIEQHPNNTYGLLICILGESVQ